MKANCDKYEIKKRKIKKHILIDAWSHSRIYYRIKEKLYISLSLSLFKFYSFKVKSSLSSSLLLSAASIDSTMGWSNWSINGLVQSLGGSSTILLWVCSAESIICGGSANLFIGIGGSRGSRFGCGAINRLPP